MRYEQTAGLRQTLVAVVVNGAAQPVAVVALDGATVRMTVAEYEAAFYSQQSPRRPALV